MAVDNNTIISKIYLEGTNDYQQGVPDPTQASLQSTINALFDPMNHKYYNQFLDTLVNRIGMTFVRGKSWTNKLAPFKGAKMVYGSTIQEIAPKWVKAHSYDDATETLLKLQRPAMTPFYHSQNRRDHYDISVNAQEVRTAFVDEFGLNSLVSSIMTLPNNRDQYDEYRIMLQLIAMYENKWGFFKYQLSATPTTEATGKEMLTAIKTFVGMLGFPSTMYNAQQLTDIPVFAKPEELILLVTPTVDANIDVNTLATVFHLDKADNPVTKVVVDEIPVNNAIALLTTRDFFVCHDTEYTTTSFWNPQRMDTTYYLQHWGIYSVSPFVPAILFTTDAGTSSTVITQTVTGISAAFEDSATNVLAGGKVNIIVTLVGTLSAVTDDVTVGPDAATYSLTAVDSAGKAITLDSATYVDEYGTLRVSKKEATGTVITVTCASTYINPNGAASDYTTDISITVGAAS